MKRGVWSRDEIRDVLVSAQRASSLTIRALQSAGDGHTRAYEQGFAAALVVLATAFGLDATEHALQDGDGVARSMMGALTAGSEEERW